MPYIISGACLSFAAGLMLILYIVYTCAKNGWIEDEVRGKLHDQHREKE
jgi:hypothetical protein